MATYVLAGSNAPGSSTGCGAGREATGAARLKNARFVAMLATKLIVRWNGVHKPTHSVHAPGPES
jgi:hypothetical protein